MNCIALRGEGNLASLFFSNFLFLGFLFPPPPHPVSHSCFEFFCSACFSFHLFCPSFFFTTCLFSISVSRTRIPFSVFVCHSLRFFLMKDLSYDSRLFSFCVNTSTSFYFLLLVVWMDPWILSWDP
ncbi:hypothetical protein COCSADRAFT_206306 [Bipolaris sorokiniana ND90Pr]|uniref:Uncharacterized protein n=1 Tax=Cochliobolus sativus (strain ND90Pr / ATCC 201652) TaxID=665912 RepID=M2SPI1_COCSN|nr:uncharacterized protein COCSADRAFT_206306 [Bipolaris sorokiniana ND90Pr]EMD69103.1 hypothetical protein COCSADRAFT_206306 [Bipolaris sorokiniana ND90Pr]